MEYSDNSTFLPPKYKETNFIFNSDCRYFTGDIPCKFWRPCLNCNFYEPITYRVLIILLRRLGDVLITSPLVKRIKKEIPNTHLTWLVNPDCASLVRMNSFVDRILVFDWQSTTQLKSETYDLILGFERTPAAAALVEQVNAKEKVGLAFGSSHNTLYPIGQAAQHFFKMNTWNDYRTILNNKTWTELYFEVAGFEYNDESYVLEIPDKIKNKIQNFIRDINFTKKTIVCLNIGGSLKTKRWPEDYWFNLAKQLIKQNFYILLVGGPPETEIYTNLVTRLNSDFQEQFYAPGSDCSIEFLCGYIEKSHLVVTGDSLGLHIAIAFNKPLVVLFGPSSPNEVIPKYKDNIIALRSTLDCSPCARQVVCGGLGGCMETIRVDQVFSSVLELLQPQKG